MAQFSLPRMGLLFSLACMIGCGPESPRREIHGIVTFDGKPLPAGMIQFESLPDQPTCNESAPIQNGAYTVTGLGGLLPGKYRVRITSLDANAPKPAEDVAPGTPVEEKKLSPTSKNLPAKYNTQSELTAEVSSTQSEPINFDLKP
ncbi:MAG: hypothetical protein LC104_06835 [Bacteroidales bacterium]|nr:hypothetical protein [Bacteroidales bacterium]